MNIINNGNSFLLLKSCLTFAAGIKNKIDIMNTITGKKEAVVSNKKLSDALFILWYMHCASRLPPQLSTDSTFSEWTIRLRPVLYRYPVILFPN